MAWTNPKTWSVGETLTAANFNTHIRDNLLMVPHWYIKTADQNVASSTALVDDTHLQFAIGANEAWYFQLHLAWTMNATGAWKVAFNSPSGSAGWWGTPGKNNSPNISPFVQYTATFVDGETTNGNQIATTEYLGLMGYVLNSSSAGTFKLRWAQAASNATNTTLKRGSYMLAGKAA